MAPTFPRVNIGDGNTWLWPVEDQGYFQSCTANAVIGMVEYLLRKNQDKPPGREERINLSRMFLYKTTRQLLRWRGDSGAYPRKTIQALALFGAPPEDSWPYSGDLMDVEPTPFCYSYAQQFKALRYMRLDENGSDAEATKGNVIRTLAGGIPVIFGFPLYRSVALMKSKPRANGEKAPEGKGKEWFYVVPPPNLYPYDGLVGGHAVMAVGYDNSVEYQYPDKNGKTETRHGALIIRNSWGYGWGNNGFAYLPYSYIEDGLACDFWTVFSEGSFSLSRFDG